MADAPLARAKSTDRILPAWMKMGGDSRKQSPCCRGNRNPFLALTYASTAAVSVQELKIFLSLPWKAALSVMPQVPIAWQMTTAAIPDKRFDASLGC